MRKASMRKTISLILVLCLLNLSACTSESSSYDTSNSAYSLYTYSPGVDGERTSRELTIATVGASNFEGFAAEFNSDPKREFTVTLVDYLGKGTREAAFARLNADLAAGKAPDIIDFDMVQSRDIYARQGLLRDMSDYFYSEFQLDDFYALNLLNKSDALYFFPSNFSIITAYGNPKIFADKSSWSISDYEQLSRLPQFAENPADTQESFLTKLHEYMIPYWVDLEQGVCRYDDGSFAEALRFAATLNDETLAFSSDPAVLVGNGRLLYNKTWISSPYDIHTIENSMGCQASFIGSPTPDGSFGSSLIMVGLVGVNAATDNADLAWEFIHFLMTESRLIHDKKVWDNISILKSAVNEKIEHMLNPYAEFEGKTIVINEDGTFEADGVHQDMTYDPTPYITEAQAETFYNLLDRTTHIYAWDSASYDIMMSCARQYLADDKTIEETVANIQSRTSIYLAEQYG